MFQYIGFCLFFTCIYSDLSANFLLAKHFLSFELKIQNFNLSLH